MTHTDRTSSREPRQYTAFALLCLAAGGAAAILARTPGSAYFQPYFGRIDPLRIIVVAGVVGAISLWFLRSRGGVEILEGGATLKGLAVSAGLATALAIPVIVVDFKFGIPVTNVPPPWSLLFYPAIALVVEVFFHLLPLALLLALSGRFLRATSTQGPVLACMTAVSLLEPTFQLFAGPADQTFSWLGAYVWLQVWAINLIQLYAFRRFGFASMYALRLVYYIYWHIIWGYARWRLSL